MKYSEIVSGMILALIIAFIMFLASYGLFKLLETLAEEGKLCIGGWEMDYTVIASIRFNGNFARNGDNQIIIKDLESIEQCKQFLDNLGTIAAIERSTYFKKDDRKRGIWRMTPNQKIDLALDAWFYTNWSFEGIGLFVDMQGDSVRNKIRKLRGVDPRAIQKRRGRNQANWHKTKTVKISSSLYQTYENHAKQLGIPVYQLIDSVLRDFLPEPGLG